MKQRCQNPRGTPRASKKAGRCTSAGLQHLYNENLFDSTDPLYKQTHDKTTRCFRAMLPCFAQEGMSNDGMLAFTTDGICIPSVSRSSTELNATHREMSSGLTSTELMWKNDATFMERAAASFETTVPTERTSDKETTTCLLKKPISVICNAGDVHILSSTEMSANLRSHCLAKAEEAVSSCGLSSFGRHTTMHKSMEQNNTASQQHKPKPRNFTGLHFLLVAPSLPASGAELFNSAPSTSNLLQDSPSKVKYMSGCPSYSSLHAPLEAYPCRNAFWEHESFPGFHQKYTKFHFRESKTENVERSFLSKRKKFYQRIASRAGREEENSYTTQQTERLATSTVSLQTVTNIHRHAASLPLSSEISDGWLGDGVFPAFITDSHNRVLWVNSGYKRIVEQTVISNNVKTHGSVSCLSSTSPSGEVIFSCDSEQIPWWAAAFSGRLNVLWNKSGRERSMVAPCDVVRLDSQSGNSILFWALDIRASLRL